MNIAGEGQGGKRGGRSGREAASRLAASDYQAAGGVQAGDRSQAAGDHPPPGGSRAAGDHPPEGGSRAASNHPPAGGPQASGSSPAAANPGLRALARLDAAFNALYTWRFNPLYHSGALVVACFGVLLATGAYLLLFYRIGAPHESVAAIDAQWWGGRWIRGMHRYASALAVVAAVLHGFRMFAQRRTWGPRALAWVSGGVLLGILFVCGWTGYVMAWDVHGQVLAAEGARILDALPVFSEPLGRAFTGEAPLPDAFFFMNLFAHIAAPVGIALFLWVHVSRLARAQLLPPKRLLWGAVGCLAIAAVAWPPPLGPKADLLKLPSVVPADWVYGFWLPATRTMAAGWVWVAGGSIVAAALLVPFLTKPRAEKAPSPSWVNPRHCTGCEQCFQDCPYEAISMVERDDGRDGLVGWVDTAKCVSCGVCAGSCAPMGVGPDGRTGRDQLARTREFLAEARPGPSDVVIVGCMHGAAGSVGSLESLRPLGLADVDGPAGSAASAAVPAARIFPVGCVGSLHTSVIEYLVRAGAGGVLVAACPPRDCRSREGVKWFDERVHNGREAELQERVDRRRIDVVYAGAGEARVLRDRVARFWSSVRAMDAARAERQFEVGAECEADGAAS